MNWSLLRRQMLDGLRGVRPLVVLVVSVVLVVVQYVTAHFASFRLTGSAPTLLRDVMLFSPDGTGAGLYTMVLPFLAALLGGGVYAVERHCGRLKGVLAREGRGVVVRTSMLSGFLLGGVGGCLPLLVNLVASGVVTPHLSFIDGRYVPVPANADGSPAVGARPAPYVLIDATSWAYPLYRFSQPLLIVCVLLLVFVISGLFACMAVGVSFFTRRRHVELLVPFVVNLAWWMLPTLTGLLVPDQWSYVVFLSVYLPSGPGQARQDFVGMAITVLGLACVALVLRGVERGRDVLG